MLSRQPSKSVGRANQLLTDSWQTPVRAILIVSNTRPQEGGLRHEASLGEQYDGSFDPSTEPAIDADLAARGDGAQGVVSVDWVNSDGSTAEVGHVFNAVRQDGYTFFVDGQTGNVQSTIGGLFPNLNIGAIRYMPIRR
jgi:hypothetical protein